MNKSIWLARLLYRHREGLTQKEILNAWADEDDAGRPMAVSTFYDNRGYLESRFGMHIECRNRRYFLVSDSNDGEAFVRQLVGENNCESSGALPGEAGDEWLTPLANAIATNCRVEVTYAPLDKAPYTTTLSPYFLRRIHGHSYVVAFSNRHSETRNFATDRITALSPLSSTFRRPATLSAEHWFGSSFGAFAGSHLRAESVSLMPLTAHLAAYLRRRPLHASQREDSTTDGRTLFHYHIALTPDFIGSLLTLGTEVRILAPESLREAIANKARAILKACQEEEV